MKQSQKTHFDQSHGAKELKELGRHQEVLFRSPANNEYIPGTIVDKAIKPHSYIMEVQGKHYCQTREHLRPIHLNIPVGKSPKQQPSKFKAHFPVPSHIPKPSPNLKSVYQPKMYLPQPYLHPLVTSLHPYVCPSPHSPKLMFPSHRSCNYYNTNLPLTAHPLSLVLTLCSLSYPQALDQYLLHLTHWRRSAQRALTVHQSHHWHPATLTVNPAVTLPITPALQHQLHPPEC